MSTEDTRTIKTTNMFGTEIVVNKPEYIKRWTNLLADIPWLVESESEMKEFEAMRDKIATWADRKFESAYAHQNRR